MSDNVIECTRNKEAATNKSNVILHSGVIQKAKISFVSSNSSFTECVRKHLYYSSNLMKHNSISLTHLVSNMDTVTTYQDPHDGKEHTFTDTFFQCKNDDGCGGAIDQTQGGDLTIKRCVFETCSCGDRGGAVSFRSNGTCTQEDNLYSCCWSDTHSGAFDSYDTSKHPNHNHRRCKYICNSARTYYGHSCIEYSSETTVDSNIYIHGRSDGNGNAGTVVNYHSTGTIVYSNCIFCDGKADNSGGLSFLSGYPNYISTYSVKFCFFRNNYGTDNTAKEIYFNSITSGNSNAKYIVHSFTATPGSTVYLQSNPSQGQD